MRRLFVFAFLLTHSVAACSQGSTDQQLAIASDIRRYLREQDIPATVTVNGLTLTIAYQAALIDYAPDTFLRQQGESGLSRMAGAGLETLEIRARDLTGQQASKTFRIEELSRPRERRASAPAIASVSGWPSPDVICSYLNEYGLPTSGYSQHDGSEWGCIGTRVTSLGGVTVPDEVTYMVTGNQSEVQEIALVAEHFYSNPSDEKFTRGRAAIAAETVAKNILGDALPQASFDAYRAAKKGEWTTEKAKIKVERENDPTGKGYSVYYRITPKVTS